MYLKDSEIYFLILSSLRLCPSTIGRYLPKFSSLTFILFLFKYSITSLVKIPCCWIFDNKLNSLAFKISSKNFSFKEFLTKEKEFATFFQEYLNLLIIACVLVEYNYL